MLDGDSAADFAHGIDEYYSKHLSGTIAGQVDSFANTIASGMADLILDQVITAVLKWREGGYSTLASTERIAVSDARSAVNSHQGRQIVETVSKSWLLEKLLPAIDQDMKGICEEFNVPHLQMGNLTELTAILTRSILPVVQNITLESIIERITGSVVMILNAAFADTPRLRSGIAMEFFFEAGIGDIPFMGNISFHLLQLLPWDIIQDQFKERAKSIVFPVQIRGIVPTYILTTEVHSEQGKIIRLIETAINTDACMKRYLGEQVATEAKKIIDKAVKQKRMTTQIE